MVPQISIHSQRGLIGGESKLGQYEIRRPQPTLKIQSTPPVITADNRPGKLEIEQSLTNNALTGGKPEEFWSRIYSQYKEIARQNVIQIVEEGNRVGDLTNPIDPKPDMALDEFVEGAPDIQIFGPAAPDNIRLTYQPNDLNMNVKPGKLEVNVDVHRPEINYKRGYVRIYMEKYPSVTITPPAIDITV